MEEEKKQKETTGACTRSLKNNGGRYALKNRFTAKRCALMAIFVALSFLVSLWSFPIFPGSPVSFLELDFGNVFILLVSFLLGPLEGVIVCVLKETLRIMAGSTGGVGELANMIVTTSYILLPSVVYQYKKSLKVVLITLLFACFIGTGAALVVNRFITFPMYMGSEGGNVFWKCFWLITAFNLIKTTVIGALTVLLYKRLSLFLKKLKI